MNGRRTGFALSVAIASALSTGATTTAYAWDTHEATRTWAGYEAATLDHRQALNADVLAYYVDAKLDGLEAWAARLSSRVDALTAREAAEKLAKVRYVRTVLSHVDGATFATRVAALDATLASIQQRLAARIAEVREATARLAAERAAERKAMLARLAAKVLGTRAERDGRCDRDHDGGWDGWDGDRDGWDGWTR